jgi:hypothetical protein
LFTMLGLREKLLKILRLDYNDCLFDMIIL